MLEELQQQVLLVSLVEDYEGSVKFRSGSVLKIINIFTDHLLGADSW